MTSVLNPYLNFNGNARQALELYTSVFGGTLTLSTFAEFGANNAPDADRIMHGQLETDAGYTIMAADVTSDMEYHSPAGFSISLSGDDGDLLHGYWEKSSACASTGSASPGSSTFPSRRRSRSPAPARDGMMDGCNYSPLKAASRPSVPRRGSRPRPPWSGTSG